MGDGKGGGWWSEHSPLYAIGIPGIAIVSQSEQTADNKGDDDNAPVQANPVTTTMSLGK